MRNATALLAILTLTLCGCSTGRTYHPFDSLWSLGYSDTRVGEDQWSVYYRGYEISQGEANDYALLRAAEVTAEAGYRYFIIAGEQNSTSTSGVGSVGVYNGTGGGYMRNSSYPEVRLSIKAYKLKPTSGGMVYDNQYLASALRKKYDL